MANTYAQQGGFKIVGQDLNRQSYAIAVQKGADALRLQINQAMAQLLQYAGAFNEAF